MAVTKLAPYKGSYLGGYAVRGRLATNVAIGIGATLTFDVDVSDLDNLTVLVQQSGAASGDITVTVAAFEFDDATPFPLGLPPALSSGPTYDGSANVNYLAQFDARGTKTVRVSVKNNNAAAQTLKFVDAFGGFTGSNY